MIWESLAEFASFETERMYLRPFAYTDGGALHTILASPSNTRFIHPPIERLEVCQQLLVEGFMRQPLGIWAIEDKISKSMIGSIRLEGIQESRHMAEIGYFLNQAYWGQGRAIEALESLIFLAFTNFGLKELRIKTHADNKASQRVAQKAGFSLLRTYKGSDRYSRQTKTFKEYTYHRKDYQIKETL